MAASPPSSPFRPTKARCARRSHGAAPQRVLALVLLVAFLAACQVRTEVAIDVAEDGSGVVTVSVGLDTVAAERVPQLENQLRVDDLEATGWTIAGPAVEADGFLWVRATKPFATPEEAGAVLAEVAGENGPFQDFRVQRAHSFARTDFTFDGTVDFRAGLAAFSDEALAAALDGEALGQSIEAIETEIGAAIDRAFTFRVAVGLPGEVESNAPTQASNGAVWEPRISEQRAITLEATSELTRTRTYVLVGVAIVGILGLVLLVVVAPIRRRVRRAITPRGRHARVG